MNQSESSAYIPRLVDEHLASLLKNFPAILINGPRAAGKTTTARRLAASTVRLDREAEAAAFKADPDSALRDRPEPVLLDEWQETPEILGAVKRAVDENPKPGRFLLTGSVRADLENKMWPGTGRLIRTRMYGLTEREMTGFECSKQSFVDKLRTNDEAMITLPPERPELRSYIQKALSGGFPSLYLNTEPNMREIWIDSYLGQLLSRDSHSLMEERDQLKLSRYFEAVAANSAGIPQHKTLYDTAGINRLTADAYDKLLSRLYVAESVPAWTSNRLERLTNTPKRYVVDGALMSASLGISVETVMADGDLLGRTIDTFVAAQLRAELALSSQRARTYHLRTKAGREEIDLIIELPGGKLIALEMKASSTPSSDDAKHLRWLSDKYQDRFEIGAVLHTGPEIIRLDRNILAVPICALWG